MWDLSKKDLQLVFVCFITVFLVSFNTLTLNSIMTEIAVDFYVGFNTMIAVIESAFIFEIAFALISIDLADRIGKKNAVMYGLALVIVSAAIIAASPNYQTMIIGKMVASLGTALVFTTNLSYISDKVGKEHRGQAITINYAFCCIGSALAPIFGYYVSHIFGWRIMILLIIPMAIILMYLFRSSDNVVSRPGLKIDYVSHLMFIVSVTLILNAFFTLQDYFAIVFGTGVLILVILLFRQHRLENKIINTCLFRSRVFLAGAVLMMIFYFVEHSVDDTVIDVMQLQGGTVVILGVAVGLTALAGALKSIKPLVQLISSLLLASKLKKRDPFKLRLCGFILLLVAPICVLIAYYVLSGAASVVLISVAFIIVAISLVLFTPQNMTIMMNDVKPNERNSASAIVHIFQNLGRIMCSLIIVNIYEGGSGFEAFTHSATIVLFATIIICIACIAVICMMMRNKPSDC